MAADDAQPGPAEHDLGAYLKAIRRRMPLILLLTGVVTAVAVVLSLAQTKEYEATVPRRARADRPDQQHHRDLQPVNYDPEAARNTLVSLIKLEHVAERVKREGLDYSTGELLDKVTTEVEANSDIVSIKALDPDPETAAAIANAFAEQYQLYRQDTVRQSLNDAADVTRSIDRLSPEEQASEQGRDLRPSCARSRSSPQRSAAASRSPRPRTSPPTRRSRSRCSTAFWLSCSGSPSRSLSLWASSSSTAA